MDPISGRQATQPSLHSFERARPASRLRHEAQWARSSHPTATFVACGVFALAVLTLVGLWTRAGAGPALDSSNIVPSSLIAALAVLAVASTYRLEHRRRPALVHRDDRVSPAYSVTARARANAAHMAGVSHIRIIGCDALTVGVAARVPSFGADEAALEPGALPPGDRPIERSA